MRIVRFSTILAVLSVWLAAPTAIAQKLGDAAADAATWLVAERARAGKGASPSGIWQADAEIIRESGSPVTEIKQMTFTASYESDALSPVRILKTKRVGFRDQVRPGETVFVRAKIAPQQ